MDPPGKAELDEIDARLGDALFGLRSWRDGQQQQQHDALDQSLGPQQNVSSDGEATPSTPRSAATVQARTSSARSSTETAAPSSGFVSTTWSSWRLACPG